MVLKWIRHHEPVFDHELKDVSFKQGPIVGHYKE